MACALLGNQQKSVAAIDSALEIEPLSLLLNANKGYILYFARRYDDSLRQLTATLEMDPEFAPTHHLSA